MDILVNTSIWIEDGEARYDSPYHRSTVRQAAEEKLRQLQSDASAIAEWLAIPMAPLLHAVTFEAPGRCRKCGTALTEAPFCSVDEGI